MRSINLDQINLWIDVAKLHMDPKWSNYSLIKAKDSWLDLLFKEVENLIWKYPGSKEYNELNAFKSSYIDEDLIENTVLCLISDLGLTGMSDKQFNRRCDHIDAIFYDADIWAECIDISLILEE